MIAQTKNGKQVLNVGKGNAAQACAEQGDNAVVGDNRKMLSSSGRSAGDDARARGEAAELQRRRLMI